MIRLYLIFMMTLAGSYAHAGCKTGPRPSRGMGSADTINAPEVSLYSNGYLYPHTDDEGGMTGKHGLIGKDGLSGWDNAAVFSKTFFYPRSMGKIGVSIRLKSPGGDSWIRVQLDSTGKTYTLAVHRGQDYITVPAGDFEISDTRYHCIEIRGLSKTGKYFPDIESVVFSGPAARNLLYNNTEYKGAPSTHLRYPVPKDSTIAWFYNEVSVPPGVDSRNAYYETNGFADGYMGIQVNSGTERRFIFSIWSNYKTNDPKEIPSDYAITLIKKSVGVFTGEFGNEGSGGHSHLVFPWKNGSTYKLLVGAKPAGDHTIYTAYYFAPENGAWRLIARWDKTKTGGKLLSGLYSFVENFGPNGDDYFKATYGNQWVCTTSGTWIELTKCTLTTTAGPVKHPRYDYGAGVEDNRFYMFTGGFKEMNNLAPGSAIERTPGGKAPDIDFSALPDK
jgi:hypothetical protein